MSAGRDSGFSIEVLGVSVLCSAALGAVSGFGGAKLRLFVWLMRSVNPLEASLLAEESSLAAPW